jgi:hypothetical protein
MDDDEIRYAATEQIMVASAICALFVGIGAMLHGVVIWPALLLLSAAALACSATLRPERRWALRGASLTSGASVVTWCALLLITGPDLQLTLVAIALAGAFSSGWAARFLHGAQAADRPLLTTGSGLANRPLEDRYVRGVIEELP